MIGQVVKIGLVNLAKFGAGSAAFLGSSAIGNKAMEHYTQKYSATHSNKIYLGATAAVGTAITFLGNYVYDNYLEQHVSPLLGESEVDGATHTIVQIKAHL